MANPQLEDGHTRIANTILEKIIASGLNGTELACLLFVIRKTYGFNKLKDEISLTQFEKVIPTSRRHIVRALKILQLVNILTLVKKGASVNCSNLWAFNKDFDSWQLVKKRKLVTKLTRTSDIFDKQLVTKREHTKDNIQKTITKDSKLFLTFKFMNEELEYVYSEVKHSTSKYGKKVIFMLAGYYLVSKGIKLEKDENYDVAPISQGLSKLLKKAGDVEKTKQILYDGAEYFKQRNLDWKPITIYNNWYEIQKWLQEGKPKNNKEIVKLNPDLYE